MKSALSFILATGIAVPFASAENTRPVLAPVHEAMTPFVEKQELAGFVTVVLTKERVLHLDAAGQADREAGRPMAADSLFWIASMTKPITAMAVMTLRDEGKLDLDDKVARFLPAFVVPGVPGANVTVRQLLTHTSGLSDVPAGTKSATLSELVARYPLLPLKFPSGTKWEYCNSGINTLGRIVEVVSGQSYADFLSARFFDPLGMKDTTFHPSAEQAKRLARTYKKNGEGALEVTGLALLFGGAVIPPPDAIASPAGGLFSTANDLVKLYQMVLGGGEFGGHRFLKTSTLKEMSALQTGELTTGFTPGASWGLGWSRVSEPQGITGALSPGSFGHGGAYGTQIWLDPVRGRGYLLLIQRADLPNADGSAFRQTLQDTAAAALK